MIIVTADDFGKSRHATDSILQCFSKGRITSTSAMVFMEDSERAASLSLKTNMEVGLHLNFSTPFTAEIVSPKLREHHNRVVSYLIKNKFSQVVYNPLLAGSFDFLFKAQLEEFIRLYDNNPAFYNGHHHMHLCANMLLRKVLPTGTYVRRTFTFDRGEKSALNQLYRHVLDIFVSRRFVSSDCFFSIAPVQNIARLKDIFDRSTLNTIEIEVHPENLEESEFLLGNTFLHLMESVHMGNFQTLNNRS